MNPIEPLSALLAHAERERDQARADADRAALACDKAQLQVDQLTTYRRDYEERWSARFRVTGHIEVVHCYTGFIERLTQALEQQQGVAEHAATRLQQARQTLAEHEIRVAAVRKMIERRLLEVKQAQGRIEQKQFDEFGSRAAWKDQNTAFRGMTNLV
jgi:flagellar FliJ protein